MAATEASRSGGPADSYIGSLISLTSKSEIRYEGVLYNINTEESSIGLRNVRSFGTEGRKKDGQQVLPSDKVYEYILFRGSDIKDLQVKSSPVVQTPPIHNDPAIIQSHYSRPPSMSTSSPASVSGSVGDLSSAQMGLQRSAFQGGLPLYQPGGGLGSWVPSLPPPSANGGALQVPMYWQGFYGPPGGLPHMHQQSLLRPPPGLSMSHSMQQSMQYGAMSASLPTGASNLSTSNFPSSNLSEFPPPLVPPVSSAPLNLTSSTMTSTLPSILAPVQTAAVASETSPSLMSNMAPTSAHSTALVTPLTASSLDVNVVAPSTANKPMTVPGPSIAYQTMSRSVSSIAGTSSSSHTEPSTPSLVTPDQLLQPGTKTLPSLQSSKPLNKDAEVVQPSSEEPRHPAQTDVQAPILPLPSPPNQKLNGPLHSRHNHNFRGRQRGRGSGARHVTQFTEDFDFMAMNEKFKKDEVWGHLGKSNKARNGNEDEDDFSDDEDYSGSSKLEKPVYVKDDFFDTLSCTALDHASGNGRTRFSEQRKLDTETFGDFPRYRGGRGGRGPLRGGRSWTPYYGRGYGYNGRGRGHAMSNRFN